MSVSVAGFQGSSAVDVESVSVSLPAGVAENDLLIIALTTYAATGVVTTTVPEGWTKVREDNSNTHATLVLFTKTATGGETAFTSTLNRVSSYRAHAYRVTGAAELYATEVLLLASSATEASITPPPITPPWTGGGLYFYFSTAGRSGNPVTSMPGGYANESGESGKNANNYGTSQASGYRASSADTDAAGDVTWQTYNTRLAVSVAVKGQGPSLTITNAGDITPGTTLTATASNFAAAPTTISLSDGASPALTPALTATASGDDYDLSALIADFKAQADAAGEGVAVQGLRIGTITATVE